MNNIGSILGKYEIAMPKDIQTSAYKEIMGFYDDAERLITIARKHGDNAEPYLDHLQKLIEHIEKNTEIILDNFFKTVEGGRPASNMQKLKVEKSAKEINIAVRQFLSKISN